MLSTLLDALEPYGRNYISPVSAAISVCVEVTNNFDGSGGYVLRPF
ncbi:hypothetical protein ACFQ1M_08640 [Sungkyunkwania multivorans]|uniref:Uncharacterized protein n=1 Tax=Sungkyunkwania multivorans TaxID=1173618 RepID=A0ABW3CZY6_9FLAO